ncbi:MAG: VIT1/CCC1 transporter family protein [Firmicutes bacterium]|nr:VIT1/CCC1 transporter family protein [Bacillota bacterium]
MNGSRWREIVFGMNDGLVATTGLVTGMTLTGASHLTMITATLTAVWAAMISMAIGSYLGTHSEVAFQQAVVARERWELDDHPEEELDEMRVIYENYGFSPDEVAVFLRGFQRDPELWLRLMIRDEHGVLPETWESPISNALVMALAVLAGSIPPLLPNLVISSPQHSLPWVLVLAGVTAIGLGWFTARLTSQRPLRLALKFLALAAAAMLLGSIMGGLLGKVG